MQQPDRRLGALRAIATQELNLMLSWRNAPSVRAGMFNSQVISLVDHLAWWDRTIARTDQKYFMYEFDHVPCGIVSLVGIDTVNSNASWGIYAAPEAPVGTGRRMAYLALCHAFEQLGLRKVCAEVIETNSVSLQFHLKVGFKFEGVRVGQHKVDNQLVDVYTFGVLAKDWRNARNGTQHSLLKKLKT
jgi:UDP-4-amino-4,6-dideoxy-N-acetyl-beta-L-altrosamine N-acetyltransferase